MSVLDGVREGRLQALRATAEALAAQIDAGGGTVAQCVAQLRAVLAEIDELSSAGAGPNRETGLSEFEKRLRERESGPTGSRRTAKQ